MTMTWMIGRQEALADPLAARRKVMERLRNLADLDDPEAQVVPILIDAILLAETYRGARHPMPFVDELIHSVDALLRELTITEKAQGFRRRLSGLRGRGPAPSRRSAIRNAGSA